MMRNTFGDLIRVFNAKVPWLIGSRRLTSGNFLMAASPLLLFAVIVFLAPVAAAQSTATVERELVSHIKAIGKFARENSPEASAKLDAENEALKAKLVKYGRLASTLKYDFPELKKYLSIATSKDRKFRIYSWDTETGGTMHFYENVFQYEGVGGKVFSKAAVRADSDPGGFYHDIFQVTGKSGPIYIGRLTATLSTRDAYEEVSLFRISGAKLDDDLRLFKTKGGMQNRIGYEYDFFSVIDRKERPIKLARFDERSNTVLIPVVIVDPKNDNKAKVTKRFIKYRFNGTSFVNVR